MWIDTHAHLDKITLPMEEVLKEAQASSVSSIITIGTELEDWEKVLHFCDNYSPKVYGALGMHPHSAKNWNEDCETFLNKHLSHPRIVAVGEIGLDYHYERTNRDQQQEVFEKQFDLAEKFKLPVEIHTREAEQDTLSLLKKYQGQVKGLLHCFTSSYEMAASALDYGFNISFSGIVTFKNSENLRETCRKLPLDRIHIETDSPFLSPPPYRGKENQPARVHLVAQTVADLHQVDLKTLSEQLQKNTLNLFSKVNKEDIQCLN
ncbi:MAG: TatD family hydrolase [Bdellovibrionales bacterium]